MTVLVVAARAGAQKGRAQGRKVARGGGCKKSPGSLLMPTTKVGRLLRAETGLPSVELYYEDTGGGGVVLFMTHGLCPLC